MRFSFLVVAFLSFMPSILLPGSVHAHDFWIEPDTFSPEDNAPVSVYLREGVDFKGNTLPYIEEWFTDFSMVSNAGRIPVISMMGNDPAAEISFPAGQTLLGYQSAPSFVELDAEKFNTYLEHEGIEFIRETRRERGEDNDPAPEYFVRCAKALLQSSKPGESFYAEELGYVLELVPMQDPYVLTIEDSLEFVLLYRGEPIEGLLLQAFTREQPELIQKVRTDALGRATIKLSMPGTWFIKAVQIEALNSSANTMMAKAPPTALWQSYWASYLFTVKQERQ
ncbi:MAG: DUF4198 domain-containing protein [Gammaproteobacteria bacterium]|nr:DUF4198 domain-containing protein [Gammaproteobacteria bacterium]